MWSISGPHKFIIGSLIPQECNAVSVDFILAYKHFDFPSILSFTTSIFHLIFILLKHRFTCSALYTQRIHHFSSTKSYHLRLVNFDEFVTFSWFPFVILFYCSPQHSLTQLNVRLLVIHFLFSVSPFFLHHQYPVALPSVSVQLSPRIASIRILLIQQCFGSKLSHFTWLFLHFVVSSLLSNLLFLFFSVWVSSLSAPNLSRGDGAGYSGRFCFVSFPPTHHPSIHLAKTLPLMTTSYLPLYPNFFHPHTWSPPSSHYSIFLFTLCIVNLFSITNQGYVIDL